MYLRQLLWIGILTNTLILSSCNKKSAEDEAADLSGETTPIVVSGGQPVSGGTLETVIATNSQGNSTVQIVSTTTVSMIVPSAADAITASETNATSITINWLPATNAASYQAYFSTVDNITSVADAVANGTLLNTSSVGRSAIAGSLPSNSLFYFNVLAIDGLGRKVAYKRVMFSTATAPSTESASAAQSIVSVVGGASTVISGSSVTVKLQAKGPSGTSLNVGGSTVFFMILSGTSTFNESFPVAAADNGNGTYTAVLSGKLAGTATAISALIDGVSSVSQTALTVLPGPVSMSTSIVSLVGNPSTVDSGSTVTIQLRAKDLAGNLLTAGGAAITFTKSLGTSSFSQSFPVTATDNGNGFYSATLTGLAEGTATTLKAAAAGVASTSSVSLGVNHGPISSATSLVSIVGGGTTVASGSNATIKFTAKDAAGNLITSGGSAISFSKSGGTSDFVQSFSLAASDAGDGTYTATLTGNVAGSAATLGAAIGATPVSSTTSLTVLPGTISPATSVVSIVGGATSVGSGSNVTVKLQAKDIVGNSLTAGSATVVFTSSGGTATFSQSFPVTATNNGNGTYTASLTGSLAGTAATIGAEINATPVTSSTSLAVTSGSASTATSVVTIVGGATTVNSGNSITVRMQAKDPDGNNLPTGGLAVTFTQTGGVSTFTQGFPVTATDNGDGTYSATLTGNVSGTTTTLGAKIGVTSVTSTTAMTVNPGAISTATSVLSIVGGASTVASGSSVTVRLTAKDAAGNSLAAGGASVDFNVSGGTSSFTQSFPVAATDVGNGTYTTSITGNVSGTAATIGATISASAVTSTTSMTVNPGTISLATSVVSIVGGGSTVASGAAATLRLQAKDAAGNNLATGGSTVTFTQTAGTSTFSQGFPLAATDNSNGTYSASVTGLVAGTAKTIGAQVGGSPVTSTTTLAVTPGSISTANSLVTAGSSTVPNGVNVQVTMTAYDSANNRVVIGGSTVTFTQTGGTSTFTQTFPVSATDNTDGTYVATLTGNVAGTATAIGAKIGASAVTSTTNIEVSSSVGATISGQPTGTNNTTVLAVTIAGTNVDFYKYKVGLTASTDCTNSTGYTGSIVIGTPNITDNISGQADGPTTLCVVGADSGPNWQPYAAATSANWTKKATPPSFTSLARINEASDGYINAADKLLTSVLAGSLVGADYTTADYKLVTSATACDGLLTYGAMPQNDSGDFSADGSYKVCVRLSDTAGNTPAYGASAAIVLKNSTPVFTSVALANDAADLFINTADRSLANALAGSLSGSSYDTAGYKLASSATTCNNSLTYGAMPLGTSGDFGADGSYKVCVKLSDAASNPAVFGASAVFELKTAAPAFTSLALANDAADNYLNAAERLLTNALAGTLSGTNYDTVAYKLVASATTCNNLLTYAAMPNGTSSDFGADGTYKVCAALSDTAGNATAYGATSNITLKSSLPGFTSLTIANDAADGYINAAEKLLTNALAASISGSNYDTAAYKLVPTATTCNVALTYGAMPAGNSADFSADGDYKVCAKLTDNAGNTPAYGASGTIALKITAPAFTSLALLNEAANGYINTAEKLLTNPLAGTLVGTSYDTAQYKLVTSATTCSGVGTYGAMPADNSGDFGADGTYKICVKLSDSAGNTPAYGSSSSATLDTVAPGCTLSTTAPNPTNTSPIPVTVTFSESVTGFISGDVAVGNGSLSSFTGSGASYSFNLTPSGQVTSTANVAASAAQDVAGNDSTVATQLSRTYDTVAPTVNGGVTSANADGTYSLAQTINITVTFSDTVSVTGFPTLTLNTTPTRSATYTSGTGSAVLTFSYTTVADDASLDLDYASTSALSGTINDGAGNNATLTLPTPGAAGSLGANKAIVIDTNAANITFVNTTLSNGAYPAGTVIPVQVNFSEAVDVNVTGGTPTLDLNTSPARSATYASGTGTPTLVFNYTVQASDTAGVLNYSSINALSLAGGTILDAALNSAVLVLPGLTSGNSLGELATISVDTTSASRTGVTSGVANSSYSIGEGIDVQVSFDEPVVVSGSPRVQLNVTNTAVTTRYATYTSGSGTGTLVFSYTVQGPNNVNGDMAPDLDYASTGALTLNGGTITDLAGNNTTLTLDTPGAAGSLGANKDIVINASLAAVLGISGVPCCATSTLKASAVELTVTFPADVSAYNNVKIFRALGATPPSAACNVGLVSTISSFTGGTIQTVVDSTGGAARFYSYRLCAFDGGGAILESATAANVSSNTLHWIFTTKVAAASGNLGGVAGANATCQTAGDLFDPSLTWLALLSDSTMEASGRLPVAGTIYNRNSPLAPVASNYDDLWNGSIGNVVQYSYDGTSQSLGAWTGTTSTGLRAASTCSDWGSSSAGVNGGNATVTSLTSTWVTNTSSTCNTAANRLYCFSKAMEPLNSFSVATPGTGADGDVAVTIDFPTDTTLWTKAEVRRLLGTVAPTCSTGTVAKTYNSPTFTDETFTDATTKASAFYSYTLCVYTGTNVAASYTKVALPVRTYHGTNSHIIFITSTTYTGALGGLAGANAKCQTRGDTFTSGKTWKAILSSSATNANSAGGIQATSNVYNVAGSLIATSNTDLYDGTIGAAISYMDTFATTTGMAWTGSTSAGAVATKHCTDWTNSSGGGNTGQRGSPGSLTATWITNSTNKCNVLLRLYCMSVTAD